MLSSREYQLRGSMVVAARDGSELWMVGYGDNSAAAETAAVNTRSWLHTNRAVAWTNKLPTVRLDDTNMMFFVPLMCLDEVCTKYRYCGLIFLAEACRIAPRDIFPVCTS
jgi:hypothetical protein